MRLRLRGLWRTCAVAAALLAALAAAGSAQARSRALSTSIYLSEGGSGYCYAVLGGDYCKYGPIGPAGGSKVGYYFGVPGASEATVAATCPNATDIPSTAAPSLWSLYASSQSAMLSGSSIEAAYLGRLVNNAAPGNTVVPQLNTSGYMGSLSTSQIAGSDVLLEVQYANTNLSGCYVYGFFSIPAAESGGHLASVDASTSSDHADLGAVHADLGSLQASNHSDLMGLQTENHADLTATIPVACAACAKDSTVVANGATLSSVNTALGLFASANHGDLMGLQSTSGSQLSSFNTATSEDAQRTDLIWWGVWILAGIVLAGLVQRYWDRLFSWWANPA